jgi:cyclohexyl-isocyanide hydratase
MAEDCTVVFALYPGVTQLDFTGPLEVLARLPGARTLLASVAGGELHADPGLRLAGLVRLADVPRCSVLCVPGGMGSIEAMEDASYLAELRRLSQGADFVASVCTGSLLLAAAGLLSGRRAACHWGSRNFLASFGATPDSARVVRDGNVFSGGGVTAGIDLALTLMAEIAGRSYAEAVQLAIEYAPAPPFDSGRPESARPEIVAAVEQRFEVILARRAGAVQRAVAALG